MELKELRNEIDLIDDELVQLFNKRMQLSAQVADYKKEHNMPIHVPAREREILRKWHPKHINALPLRIFVHFQQDLSVLCAIPMLDKLGKALDLLKLRIGHICTAKQCKFQLFIRKLRLFRVGAFFVVEGSQVAVEDFTFGNAKIFR